VATTRTQWAEDRLRTAIVTGELEPGERIRIEQLAADWQLSPTPLREAVRALAHAGLVELTPQRGATVAGLSPGEMANIYELRLLLEPRALRLSLHRRSWGWRAEVETAWHALQAAWGDATHAPPRIEPAHTAFHEALTSGCGNAELLRLTRRLAAQSMRILLLAMARGDVAGPTLAEHVALYDACVEGEVDDAMREAIAHIARTIATTIGPASLAALGERIAEAGGGDPLLGGVLDGLT
jgi:GntR family transcriptional regulator, carbon starvation induced regulator